METSFGRREKRETGSLYSNRQPGARPRRVGDVPGRGYVPHYHAGTVYQYQTGRLFPTPPHLRLRLGQPGPDHYL